MSQRTGHGGDAGNSLIQWRGTRELHPPFVEVILYCRVYWSSNLIAFVGDPNTQKTKKSYEWNKMDEWVTDVKMKPCSEEVSKHSRDLWYQHVQWWRLRASLPAYCTSCFGWKLLKCCPPKFNKNDFGSAILLNLSSLATSHFSF